jgi:hypothetical protein
MDFNVHLPDGKEKAGVDLAKGDNVLIYESGTGRSERVKKVNGEEVILHRGGGRRGIYAIAELTGGLKAVSSAIPSQYTDGTTIWWRWRAMAKPLTTNGFIPLAEVNRVLHLSPNYNLRAFGDYKSGLKKIEPDQFFELRDIFLQNPRVPKSVIKPKSHPGRIVHRGEEVESESHLRLKQFVAANPSLAIGETGLKTVAVEYDKFGTGDRADIVLEDAYGRMIGLEVEVSVDNTQYEGLLQAIKYRYMLAPLFARLNYETRAFLVAHSIIQDVRELCDRYEVEYFIIDKKKMTTT